MVSYEIPMVLSLLVVILMSGSLSLQSIIMRPGSLPDRLVPLFQVRLQRLHSSYSSSPPSPKGTGRHLTSPRPESELVAGYNTEYSGMRFLLPLLAEWGNIYVIGALAASLFLGGWQVPESWRLLGGLSRKDHAARYRTARLPAKDMDMGLPYNPTSLDHPATACRLAWRRSRGPT